MRKTFKAYLEEITARSRLPVNVGSLFLVAEPWATYYNVLLIALDLDELFLSFH